MEMTHIVAVNWSDRWQVYQRIRELDIPCSCADNQPLKVIITNPTVAIQLWSVVQQYTASRQDLVAILEKCWHSRYQKF
jgi:hypothetical protein